MGEKMCGEMEGDNLQQGKETELVVERVGMIYIEARKVCSFYLRNKCFYGNGCRDEHPDLCEDTMLSGSCADTTYCNRYHPEVCRKYRDTGICRYGDRCYYIHQTNAPHTRPSHEQGYGEYNNYQQGYRQYDWRWDQTQH